MGSEITAIWIDEALSLKESIPTDRVFSQEPLPARVYASVRIDVVKKVIADLKAERLKSEKYHSALCHIASHEHATAEELIAVANLALS